MARHHTNISQIGTFCRVNVNLYNILTILFTILSDFVIRQFNMFSAFKLAVILMFPDSHVKVTRAAIVVTEYYKET